jgi:myo-inositol-1(or 4)-monophosphatase
VADKNTEQLIRERLRKKFPGHGIMGEEFGHEDEEAEFIWTVDPIDGTRSFVRGIPLWGTLLGLMHRRQPVIGVMVLPALEETYAAAKGLGATCNGERVHVSATTHLKDVLIAYGDFSTFQSAGKEAFLKKLLGHAELARGYTDCFGHAMVIRGAVDAMIDPIVSLWDVMPIACILEEAGGAYFSFRGEKTFADPSFIACAPALKSALLEL